MELLIALSFLRAVMSPVNAFGSKDRDTSTKSLSFLVRNSDIKKGGLSALLFISDDPVLCKVSDDGNYSSYLSLCSLIVLDRFSSRGE